MREIKFRAWDGKEMHQNVVIVDGKTFKNEKNAGTPMQYTGLKDKDGKEIYEGDVINGMEVYWSDEWAMWAVKGSDGGALVRFASISAVSGNIHEMAVMDS